MMPQESFAEFRRTFGAGARYREFTPSDDERLRDRIPEVMRLILEQDGWCSYRDQGLWICDPNDWESAAYAWLPDAQSPEVLARSAFGDLYVLDNTPTEIAGFRYSSMLKQVLARSSVILTGPDDLNWFFGGELTGENFSVNSVLPAMVQTARATAGPLEWDEMYTFVPALALGGSVESSKLERVKAREQLTLLAQLAPIQVY
jgi:hypothetical protein